MILLLCVSASGVCWNRPAFLARCLLPFEGADFGGMAPRIVPLLRELPERDAIALLQAVEHQDSDAALAVLAKYGI